MAAILEMCYFAKMSFCKHFLREVSHGVAQSVFALTQQRLVFMGYESFQWQHILFFLHKVARFHLGK